MDNTEELLEDTVNAVIRMEESLEVAKQELELNPQFKQFLEYQRTVNQKAADAWKTVEQEMIKHEIKQLKGSFGTITLAERLNWDVDEELLPKKFIKKVVDTTKLSATYRLEGKAPKGATPKYTKYLTKRLKKEDQDGRTEIHQ